MRPSEAKGSIYNTMEKTTMKAQILGIKHITGISKEKGTPFTLCNALIALPIENLTNANVQITGYGFDVSEMAVLPEALPQFSGLKYPCSVELVLDLAAYRGKVDTVISGIRV